MIGNEIKPIEAKNKNSVHNETQETPKVSSSHLQEVSDKKVPNQEEKKDIIYEEPEYIPRSIMP